MPIALGNLSVQEIEKRLEITLSEDHRALLESSRQEPVNNTPLGDGKWHCFDIPFMILCDTMDTALKLSGVFMSYKISDKQTFQIRWER